MDKACALPGLAHVNVVHVAFIATRHPQVDPQRIVGQILGQATDAILAVYQAQLPVFAATGEGQGVERGSRSGGWFGSGGIVGTRIFRI